MNTVRLSAAILLVLGALALLARFCTAAIEPAEAPNEVAILMETSQRRTQIAADVVAGRCTLSQAAAQFRDLGATCPAGNLPYLRFYYPGRIDEELHFLHVLHYVDAMGPTLDDEGCRRLSSIKEEFERRRATGAFDLDGSAD